MKIPKQAVVLKIFIGENDHYKGKSLFEQIVLEARKLHLAGATVYRGIMGYGASSRVHSTKILSLSEDLPIVVEIVDSEEKINLLMPFLDETVKEGLVTIESLRIITYRHNKK